MLLHPSAFVRSVGPVSLVADYKHKRLTIESSPDGAWSVGISDPWWFGPTPGQARRTNGPWLQHG